MTISVISTLMTAAVLAAGMSLAAMLTVMVTAAHIRIKCKCACDKGVYCLVCAAADSAEKLYSAFLQRHLRTAAYAAAYQHVRLQCRKHACKRTVTGAVCIDYLRLDYFAVLDVVHLEVLGVTEMLKDISVFISYCDSHCVCSFLNFILQFNLSFYTILFIAKGCVAVAKADVSAADC